MLSHRIIPGGMLNTRKWEPNKPISLCQALSWIGSSIIFCFCRAEALRQTYCSSVCLQSWEWGCWGNDTEAIVNQSCYCQARVGQHQKPNSVFKQTALQVQRLSKSDWMPLTHFWSCDKYKKINKISDMFEIITTTYFHTSAPLQHPHFYYLGGKWQ